MTMIPARRETTFSAAFRQEFRLMSADRTVWIAAALLLALMGYSLFNGLTYIVSKERVIESVILSDERRLQNRIERLRNIYAGTERPDTFTNPVDPSRIGGSYGARYAVMPLRPLSPLAIGQADLLPSYYRVSYVNKSNFVHDDDFENPWHLLSGHLDPAFAIVYLLPLLIFAFGYNFLSAEREQGTLRMLLSQPMSLCAFVAGKMAARALVLTVLTLLPPLIVIVAARPVLSDGGELASLLLWGGLVASYSVFWFALTFLVNTFGRTSAFNALTLVGLWVLLVLIVPLAMNALVTSVHSTPSRAEMVHSLRHAYEDASARYRHLQAEDYETIDELLPRDGKLPIQPYMRGFYLVEEEVGVAMRPVLESFDLQIGRQQQLLERIRFLSPAVLAQEAMTDLAGTSLRRHRHFEALVDEYHAAWRAFFYPRVAAQTALVESDFHAMPRFQWREGTTGDTLRRASSGLLGLLASVLVLLALGLRMLKSYPRV